MNTLQAGMAEYQVSSQPAILVALGLGSCVGVCMYDRLNKIGGLLHIMLPDSSQAKDAGNKAKFADTGIPLLLEEMKKAGAISSRLEVKIAGGAQMFKTKCNSLNIGERNIAAAREIISKLGLRIIAEDVGGTVGRTVKLDSTTGQITIKTIGEGERVL